MAEFQGTRLNAQNPWPGLSAFSEDDKEYFHGRDAEAADVVRLIRRESLTVLFGRSGLGKTSLLAAGVFPLLRPENYLPIHIRISFVAESQFAQQCLDEVLKGCDKWHVEAPAPVPGATLWEFLQRNDAKFWSARNRPVTPVLVFDQFEELFTLGRKDEATMRRCVVFLEELADVVENRPPTRVKQAIEADPDAAARFDFQRPTCKIVLSFREDFLGEFEGLTRQMPSLMRNRYRLQPMNGQQAHEVIMSSGLVDEHVAGRIIGLAWRNAAEPPPVPADYPHMEIDPALFSVICTELNNKRLNAKPPLARITAALLYGAESEILAEFYDRCFANLDARVRTFVEDELITERGYRDSYALEDAIAGTGVSQQAIDQLVDRRLLRVDERFGVRRLELTHDVMTKVVMDSRDSRKAREAEAAAQAAASAAREREQEALRQQARNRRNSMIVGAAGFAATALLVFAGWAWWQVGVERKEAAKQQERAEVATELSRVADRNAQIELQRARDASIAAESAKQIAETEQERAEKALAVANAARQEASQLLREANTTRLMAHADRLQDAAYDLSLLLAMQAGRPTHSLDTRAGVLKRVVRNPHLSAFLHGAESGSLSPDGKTLATGYRKTITLWDVAARKPLATLEGHRGDVYDVAFSPDGETLASSSVDKTIILWDAAKRKPIATLEANEKLFRVTFSPDGKTLASVGEDKKIILWDVAGRKPLATLEAQDTMVAGVAFSPDGKMLASGSVNRTVTLWNVADGRPFATLEGHKDWVFGVAFSPDGKTLASASGDKTVILWDLADRKPFATLEAHKNRVLDVAFSPDGKTLASASWDNSVIIWDVASRKPLATLEGHKHFVAVVIFSPDGKTLASVSADRTVILWDLATRKPFATLEGHGDQVVDVAFSPDRKTLASVGWDGTVIFWDVASRKPLATLKNMSTVLGVSFSPDGKTLASGSYDKTVVLWNVADHKPLATLEGHKDAVQSVAFSPDGKTLASGSYDKTVVLWNVADHKPLGTLEGHKEIVNIIAFSPDGRTLASGSFDNTVILWNVADRKPLGMLEGHKAGVRGVAFSPDGKTLASASDDNTVMLWNVSDRKLLATLPGHKDEVTSVAFSPDGKTLASASADKTVILRDVVNRKLLATLEGHKDRVLDVAFSPDGKTLASGSEDKTVILWPLDIPLLEEEACRKVNRNLTCDEWQTYVGADKPYRKLCESLPGPGKCQSMSAPSSGRK